MTPSPEEIDAIKSLEKAGYVVLKHIGKSELERNEDREYPPFFALIEPELGIDIDPYHAEHGVLIDGIASGVYVRALS